MNIKIDDLNIDYELSDITVNDYANSAVELEINIQFKCSDKKRMTTKILNKIKTDINFQNFLRDTVEKGINQTYSNITSQLVGISDSKLFKHKLDVWLTGNKLKISNVIISFNTIEELKTDMEYLINGFLKNEVSRTVYLKVKNKYQKI